MSQCFGHVRCNWVNISAIRHTAQEPQLFAVKLSTMIKSRSLLNKIQFQACSSWKIFFKHADYVGT